MIFWRDVHEDEMRLLDVSFFASIDESLRMPGLVRGDTKITPIAMIIPAFKGEIQRSLLDATCSYLEDLGR